MYRKLLVKKLSDYIEANVAFMVKVKKPMLVPRKFSNTFGFDGHNAVLAFNVRGLILNISEIKDLLAQFDASTH